MEAVTRLAAWIAGGVAAAYGIVALDLGAAGTLLAGWLIGTLAALGAIVGRARRFHEPPRLRLLWDDRDAASSRPD